jgi:DNA-binding beta-propeller fold protein YncE
MDAYTGKTHNFKPDKQVTVELGKTTPLSIFTVGVEDDGCPTFGAHVDNAPPPKYLAELEPVFKDPRLDWWNPISNIQSKIIKENLVIPGCSWDHLGMINKFYYPPGQSYEPIGYGAGAHTNVVSSNGDFTLRYTIGVMALTPPPVNEPVKEPPANGFYAFITKWGTQGSGNGQFANPYGISVDPSGDVYVVDHYIHRIQKFTNDGTFITKWGTQGSGNGQFNYPDGVDVDSSGNVYVADTGNQRIQKFTNDGTFITKWGTQGSGNGQFNYPAGVDVDSSGGVYVAESNNNRIQKFTSDGTFVKKWGTQGSGNGQFNHPLGVAVDSSGGVYVADSGNQRIQKLLLAGTCPAGTTQLGSGPKHTAGTCLITKWGTPGSGNGQFANTAGVAIDSSSGRVYVSDSNSKRIQVFLWKPNLLNPVKPPLALN